MALAVAAGSASAQPDPKMLQQEAVIDALLKQPAPLSDWREHLNKRKQVPRPKPPADAPIDELMDYWRGAPDTEIPDEASRMRLLEACEAAPNEISSLLPRLPLDLPEAQSRLKRVYDRLVAERGRDDASEAELIRDALMTHSQYFRDELIRRVFFPDDIGEDRFVEATAAFIRLDREGARKLFLKEAASNELLRRVLALSNLLQQFAAEADAQTRTAWQKELKRIVADSKSERQARRFALLAVMSAASAQDEQWFLNLFRDPTLSSLDNIADRSTLLGDVVATKPDYWIPKVAALVGNKQAWVHTNAVYALIQFQLEKARADALRPLLPWLENPRWVQDTDKLNGRLRLLESLDRVDLPEAVPGLLKAAETGREYELEGIAGALAHYHARPGIEPLKRGLAREKDFFLQQKIAREILKLDGFSPDELVEALKLYALKMSTPAGQKDLEYESRRLSSNKIDYRVSVGKVVADAGLSDDAVAKAVLEGAASLVVANPAAAELLRQFVAKWQTPTAIKAVAERLRSGELTAPWVQQLVEARATVSDSLVQIRNLEGAALGVQAGVTGNSALVQTILSGNDQLALRALLAVARLGRIELPIAPVEKFLTASDKHLAKAAELYLEANDSAPAREALWAHSKNQARVLGYPHSSGAVWKGDIYRSEDEARALVLASGGPQEIYALLSEGTWGGRGQALLLRYEDRAILRRNQGNGRFQERELTLKEMDSLKEWTEREQIDDLPPFDTGTADGVQYEYLHLTRTGGRRVYMNNPPGANAAPRVEFGNQPPGPDPAIYGELTTRLESLSKPAMKVSYPALEKIPGYRIVHGNEQGEINSIGMKNAKSAVSVRNHHNDSLEWHVLTADGLSDDFTKEVAPSENSEPSRSDKAVSLEEGPLKGSVLVPDWSGHKRDDGLWAVTKNKKRELIAPGVFSRPVVCPGGEWIVVAKTPNYDSWSSPNGVVRIDLRSKKMFPVNLPPADNFDPLAWIDAHQRVLLYRQRDDPRYFGPSYELKPDAGPEKSEFYLLDVPTGDHKRIEGEFRPLQRLEGHSLQSTGNPNEFWAVILENEDDPKPTSVLGRYDTLQFRFTETQRLPGMWFHSWDVRVDEPAGAIWIAVNGDLLRLSLPSNSPPSK